MTRFRSENVDALGRRLVELLPLRRTHLETSP
jgi:hypothetical protein